MQRMLLALALVALDALWIGAVLRWYAAAGSPGVRPPGLIATLVIGVSALIVTRLLLSTQANLAVLRVVSLLIAVAVVVLVARATLYPWAPARDGLQVTRLLGDLTRAGNPSASARLLVMTSVLLWWRGTRYGLIRLRPAHAKRAVGLAVGVLTVVAVLVSITHPVDLAPWILGALVMSLLALAMSRLAEARAAFGGTAFNLGPVWLGALFAAMLAVGLVALVLTPVLSVESADALVRVLKPLPDVLYRLFALAVLAVARIVFEAVNLVRGLIVSVFGENQLPFTPEPSTIPQDEVLPWRPEGTGAPKWVVDIVRIGVFLAGMALAAWWLGRTLRRFEDREHDGEGAQRESQLSLGRIRDDLLSSLRAAAAGLSDVVQRFGARPHGVRALYAQLLGLAAELGHARRVHETPLEYGPRVRTRFPSVADEVTQLTEAYVAARYGELEPDEPTFAALRNAWHRIRKAAESGPASA